MHTDDSITKSERDSVDAKPTERSYGKNVVLSEGWYSNPSVLTGKSLINQKGGCIASKTQQSDSLCLAVNPPPFDKGGKDIVRGEGLLSFCNGWRVTVFGATGGTGKTSDKCSFAKVVEMERVDATGGASKARMP